MSMPKGGQRAGAGRKPKPPAELKKRVTFRLSPATVARLKREKNQSNLIETLLTQYFERTER